MCKSPNPHTMWCYLLCFRCLMMNRFSSVHGVHLCSRPLSSPFTSLPYGLIWRPMGVGLGLEECLWCSSKDLLLLLFFLFTFSFISSLPPPLGKSSSLPKASFAGGSGPLVVGTSLLGFHSFTELPLPCCWCLSAFVFSFVADQGLSLLNLMWFGLWLLGVLWVLW